MMPLLISSCIWFRILLVLVFVVYEFKLAKSLTIVKTLPGYHQGALPFQLETGYVGVGENEEVQLFYYFIESERDPVMDPLVLWLTGGPGCSGFSALVYEFGPLSFDIEAFNGSLPSFVLNPYGWTKIANIIFVDLPAGTGFSYAATTQGYYSSDTKSAKDAHMFLRKWLLNHTKFTENRLYIGGESYAGKFVPVVVQEILTGNEAGLRPRMSVQGYIMGNPMVNSDRDRNWRVPYANRMGLMSDEYYKLAKDSCNGEYINPNRNNTECLYALQLINQCTSGINLDNILEPKCRYRAKISDELQWGETFQEEDAIRILLPSNVEEGQRWCRFDNYETSSVWASDPIVQEALGVPNGTKEHWKRCNKSLAYEYDVISVFHHHQVLSRKELQVLVYSGDHDMAIPYIGTVQWIKDLNLTLEDDWRPWFLNGQIAGYTFKYRYGEDQFYITFATVKGAGHTAPEYKPKECLAMIDRWFSYYPL